MQSLKLAPSFSDGLFFAGMTTLLMIKVAPVIAMNARETNKPTLIMASKYPRPTAPKLALGAPMPGKENIIFPADAGLIDVTKAPYGAKGDGVSDDTGPLQKALLDHVNQNAMIYLPNGVYLISDTLKWPPASGGKVSYGFEGIQGQSRDGTILKLKDQTFTNPNRAHAVIGMGAHGSADFFGNTIFNLTIDTGVNNPGAIGMQFFSNNEGCVRDVTIQSGDGWGKIGLDMAYNDMNGPLLIKNVKVIGFNVGIQTATSVNSETMEHITVENQTESGFLNDGQCVSIHDFKSVNNVSAVVNKGSGLVTLIDAKLTGKGAASTRPAIVNEAALLGRNITVTGYRKAIQNDGGGKLSPEGLAVAEFISDAAISLFPSPPHTLNLPIKETPEVAWDDLKNWANPAKFRKAADKDDTASIQAAIDSGASTVYFPRGDYKISDTILIRNNVRRLIGCRANIDVPEMAGPGFKVVEGANPVVVFERINSGYSKAVTIENAPSGTARWPTGFLS